MTPPCATAARVKASISQPLDKLRIAEKLDAFGIHYIEGGWPGSNPKDMEFFAPSRAPQMEARFVGRFQHDSPQRRCVENDELNAPNSPGRKLR
jgi:isopropylmalate/homocitrate/citramalate synthase